MEATRARFGSALEWIVAAAFMIAAFLIGSVIMRQLRTVDAAMPVIAKESIVKVAAPEGVPARVVSIPVLLLPDNREVRVGETFAAIAARLGREAEVGTQTVERGRYGDRLTRFYEHRGTRFVLVFEPFEQDGEAKVAAIYLQ